MNNLNHRLAQERARDLMRAAGGVRSPVTLTSGRPREPLATAGVTAIADSPDGADALYEHVSTVLARPGSQGAFPARALPARAAFGTTG